MERDAMTDNFFSHQGTKFTKESNVSMLVHSSGSGFPLVSGPIHAKMMPKINVTAMTAPA